MKGAYHLKITVKDGKRSKRFYDKLFSLLEWETVYEEENLGAYSDGKFTLWVVEAEKEDPEEHIHGSVGFHHLALRVDSRKAVDKVFAWCEENSVEVTDEPKEYPEYDANYYAVFFNDPDGLRLEVTYV